MRELSIIILQHNTPKEVIHNLKALNEATLPKNTEIIVVDNGGKNANEAVQKHKYPNLHIKFFSTPNDGFPAGNNFGLMQTKAKNYAFINPDIVIKPDSIQKLLQYLKANPQAGIISPQLRYADDTIQDNYRVFPRIFDLIVKRIPFLRKRFPNRMRNYLMWDREPGTNQTVDWVTGAFTLITAECLEAVGNHDDKTFFLFMSDVAICREAWDKGYEVHIVGEIECLHNDERLSGGGIKDIFKKKVLRLHIKDAVKYFWHYAFKKFPEKAPSVSNVKAKQRLMQARQLKGMSLLTHLNKKLQKNNPVVTVYEGHIEGNLKYNQPIVFFDTGVIAVIQNSKDQFGLMRIWRHCPLQFNKNNTFPLFPDPGNLGIWSIETVRGGVERGEKKYKNAVLRELNEEIGLQQDQIEEIQRLGSIIGNTAIDVYRHILFKIKVKDSFKFKCQSDVEHIKDFAWYSKKEIKELLKSEEISCGVTQAALLQAMI